MGVRSRSPILLSSQPTPLVDPGISPPVSAAWTSITWSRTGSSSSRLLFVRQPERDQLSGESAGRGCDHDVLLAVERVGHGSARLSGGHRDRAHFLTGRLVVSAQHNIRLARAPLAANHQCFGYQDTENPRPAGARNVQALERRVIANIVRTLSVRDLPEDLTFVQIDRVDASIGWLHQRQALHGEAWPCAFAASACWTGSGRRASRHVRHIGLARVARDQPDAGQAALRGDISDVSLRIVGTAGPIGAA